MTGYTAPATILPTLIINAIAGITLGKGDVEMKTFAKQFSRRSGFTVVELLTAIAIIAALISLIIPALHMVQRSADMAKQRAQFHSIDIALEAFRADFGDYPESIENSLTGGMFETYPGAMKLAEAIIGQDGFGFHPESEFNKDGLNESEESLYLNSNPPLEPPIEDNLSARRGPYLELETANAVTLGNLYEGYFPLHAGRFVLCDMFRLVRNNATGKRTGMPILYYRANTSNFIHDPENYDDDLADNIYDYRDNDSIVLLTQLWEGAVFHPMCSTNPDADGPAIFYTNTLNPNFPPTEDPYFPGKPYRADSFILLSAGPDGQYGTPDDVFNFNRDQ